VFVFDEVIEQLIGNSPTNIGIKIKHWWPNDPPKQERMTDAVRVMGTTLEQRGWRAMGAIGKMINKQSTFFKIKRDRVKHDDHDDAAPTIDMPEVVAGVVQ
jgi:hypothetical protein